MYPTLTDFLRQIFGINIPLPVQTYGFFVALAFITATIVLMFEIKRKTKLGLIPVVSQKVLVGEKVKPGELVVNAIIGFIIGYKLFDSIARYNEFVNNPQDFILSAQGSWVGGIVLAIVFAAFRFWVKNKEKLDKPRMEDQILKPQDIAGNLLIIAAISGILGAKIFHNLENFNELIEDPIGSIFSFSGLTFYGGLICGSAAGLYYGYKNKIKPLYLLDVASPALAFGYGMGRLGCHFSGDGCWGVINNSPKPGWLSFLPDWIWSYNFPHNVINTGKLIENCSSNHCHVLSQPVFPTSFYEAVIAFATFALLWSLRKKINIPGLLFSIYIILTGIARFFIEKIRVNTTFQIANYQITQAELISSLLIIFGIALLIYTLKRKNYNGLHKDLPTGA